MEPLKHKAGEILKSHETDASEEKASIFKRPKWAEVLAS